MFHMKLSARFPVAKGLHDFLSSTAIVGYIFRSDWFAAATSYAISGQWFDD